MQVWNGEGNLTQFLVRAIGSSIVKGKYLPGDTLPTEAELSATYEASRSVTREALKMLAAKGLVRSWPRRGTVVQKENNWNLLDNQVLDWMLGRKFAPALLVDFMNMRLAIEPVASMMAAANKDKIAPIGEAIEKMKLAMDGVGDALSADKEFHTSILRASGNRFFEQMVPLVDTALQLSIKLTNRMKGVQLASVEDHEKIYLAIKSGNGKKARKLSEAMILEALDLIKTGVKESSQPPS